MSGHTRVVSEMVAGSVARPALGREVMALSEPWVKLAEDAVERVLAGTPLAALAKPRELALAGITFHLGANLVTHVGQATKTVESLLASAERLAGMLEPFGPAAGGAGKDVGQ